MGSLSCLMQCCGFEPPLRRIFLVEGIFPLELAWVLTPFPQISLGFEYQLRSSLCTHAFHRMESKDPDIHVLDGWMPATKTLSVHHPRRQNVTTSMVGLKNEHICKNLTQSGEPQRYSWGTQKRKKKSTRAFYFGLDYFQSVLMCAWALRDIAYYCILVLEDFDMADASSVPPGPELSWLQLTKGELAGKGFLGHGQKCVHDFSQEWNTTSRLSFMCKNCFACWIQWKAYLKRKAQKSFWKKKPNLAQH